MGHVENLNSSNDWWDDLLQRPSIDIAGKGLRPDPAAALPRPLVAYYDTHSSNDHFRPLSVYLPDDRRVVRRKRSDCRVRATVRGRLAFAAFVAHRGGGGGAVTDEGSSAAPRRSA